MHAIYLFDDAGRPDLAQKWLRWALTTRYAAAPEGLDGQDDAGALSAWYVFSALGFYPRAGTPSPSRASSNDDRSPGSISVTPEISALELALREPEPMPTLKRVKLAQLRDHLPVDTPVVTLQDRAEELRLRVRACQRRRRW